MFIFRSYRHLSLGELLIAIAIIAISIAAKQSNNKFQGDGQDVIEIGPAPNSFVMDEESADREAPGSHGIKLGLRYEHIDLVGIDFWRSNGHLIAYEQTMGVVHYVDLTDEDIAQLGISTPWRYYLPEGLIVLACIAELFLVARKKRTIRFALITGGVFGVIALVFRLGGLTWECALPGLIALHHIGTALPALWASRHETADEIVASEEPPEAPVRPSAPARPNKAAVDANPFRAPPQPQPIVVRAATAPTTVPMAHDPNAEKPKLLT